MAKRTYVKPELLYENFILAEHIAACYYHTNFKEPGSCKVVTIGGVGNPGNLFIDSSNFNCGDGTTQEYCYTPGAGGNNIYAS